MGNEFHKDGDSWRKLRLVTAVLGFGWFSDVRSLADLRARAGVYNEIISWRYDGASPVKHLNVKTSILNCMRICTGNQCKPASTGVMWSRGFVRVTDIISAERCGSIESRVKGQPFDPFAIFARYICF